MPGERKRKHGHASLFRADVVGNGYTEQGERTAPASQVFHPWIAAAVSGEPVEITLAFP